jgi:hypothetical protein
MGKKNLIKLINSLLVIFIVFVFIYSVYRYSKYYEKFDEKIQKIEGTTTMLNGQNNTSPSSTSLNEPVPSYEKKNELPEKVVPTPAEIVTTNKIIKATVPKSPKPLNVNLPSYSSPSKNDKTSAVLSPIPKETNPNVPPLNSGGVASDPSKLTPKEKQLFDAFLQQRITDDKVHEMIESGVLNEQLVEKFLKLIDDLPEGPSVNKAPKKMAKNYTVDKENKNENLIEGFMSGGMAKY